MPVFGATLGSWLVRGYVEAVERFREQAAVGSDSAREVYPPLFEALKTGLTRCGTRGSGSSSRRTGISTAFATCATVATTQLASAIYPDAAAPGGWRWYAARPRRRSATRECRGTSPPTLASRRRRSRTRHRGAKQELQHDPALAARTEFGKPICAWHRQRASLRLRRHPVWQPGGSKH